MLKRIMMTLMCFGMSIVIIAQNPEVKTDTASKATTSGKKPKPYKDIITAKAITDNGLFKIHKVDEAYFFEIPDSLFSRDILISNRISKAAAGIRPEKGFYGYAGDQIGENVIQFCKGPNDKIFIKRLSFSDRSLDSSKNGMYYSVQNSNFQPIMATFDIKAYSSDSSAIVIEVTKYISEDNDILFFDSDIKKQFKLSGLQADKSYISRIKSFPENVEITTVKTYSYPEGNFATYELNSSIVLLPKNPMKTRYWDERVGYFGRAFRDFDDWQQGVKINAFITKWRLEPKFEDIEKYNRGELVEPQKPIVYYIDPATPKKWIPYLINGVNAWQKAFEKAGFKNAIYAIEVPENDSTFSLEDARHNVIIYKPSSVYNAYGPHIHDPRTGEILETKVGWFHNIMELLHDWYMIQAGAVDSGARKLQFDDDLMGKLIQYVCTHEVGHTLGLAHNFGASSTVPVDSLRSRSYLERYGHTPSIMDYARFNYVAQPEDHIGREGLVPKIGEYDEWAIEWGYRWLPELKNREEEKAFMDEWIINRLAKNSRLWYGRQSLGLFGFPEDPRSQSEDLGDDVMKSNTYGIENLKKIQANLVKWASEPHTNAKALARLSQALVIQYYQYLMQVQWYFLTWYITPKTFNQPGPQITFVPGEKLKNAVQFFNKQLFQTPLWLINRNAFESRAGFSPNVITDLQQIILGMLMTPIVRSYLSTSKQLYPEKNSYGYDEYLDDLESEIWKELKTGKAIDEYRRRLQKDYVYLLLVYDKLLNKGSPIGGSGYNAILERFLNTDDYVVIAHRHIRKILAQINKILPKVTDADTREHLIFIKERIKLGLDPNSIINSSNPTLNSKILGIDANMERMLFGIPRIGNSFEIPTPSKQQNCWHQELPEFLKIYFGQDKW